jgi:hypothetical protein
MHEKDGVREVEGETTVHRRCTLRKQAQGHAVEHLKREQIGKIVAIQPNTSNLAC